MKSRKAFSGRGCLRLLPLFLEASIQAAPVQHPVAPECSHLGWSGRMRNLKLPLSGRVSIISNDWKHTTPHDYSRKGKAAMEHTSRPVILFASNRINQPPPPSLVERAGRFPSPFYTVDFAELDNGTWTILETGDGQVSGLATEAFTEEFMAKLFKSLVYAKKDPS